MGSLPDARVRRIAIIGAGPAGITAAKLVTHFLHSASYILPFVAADRRSDTFWRKDVLRRLMYSSNRRPLVAPGTVKNVERKPKLMFHKSTQTSL